MRRSFAYKRGSATVACDRYLSKLFERPSTLKAIRAWDQSLSEIFVFAHFESLGILHSIGWPSDFPTDAPFDFAINIQGNIVAGDVKPANGSGYRLLEQTLRRCVSEQAEQLAIAVPRVTIRYHGPLTQEIVGAALESSLISDFKLRIVDLSLLEPQTFVLPIGSTIVNVILGETEELGGGISGTSLLSDALAVTFKNHIEIKGSHGSKYDVPFLVAYVRLPGRGSSDLKTYASFGDTVAKAITLLGSPTSSWLGNLLLCPGTQGSKPRFYKSSNAIWPVGISANTLSHGLGAMLTPVPRFLEDIHG
jgi:hypothetical protein